jgi:RNA-directed DNA polymerase
VFEGDITACFDEISHSALIGRVRARIGDKRVVALVKEFVEVGMLSEDGISRDRYSGAHQGGHPRSPRGHLPDYPLLV